MHNAENELGNQSASAMNFREADYGCQRPRLDGYAPMQKTGADRGTLTSVSHAECSETIAGVCLARPSHEQAVGFFGFAEFMTALTLIAVVFTISDTRYRFRIAVAPIPLIQISFWSAALIGFLVLLSDVWFSRRWLLPAFLSDQTLWQGGLAAIFLTLVLVWIYFAFLKPARFGNTNARQFARELYRTLVRGDDAELPTIASELGLSVARIVSLCAARTGPPDPNSAKRAPSPAAYAHDLLLLIGNRKFCKHVVASAPGTAIQLFQAASSAKRYDLPLKQFAINISTEAIRNTDSIFHHEDEGYRSGLIGYIKPFSAALYGDYRLVEGLAQNFGSPLDIDYRSVAAWNAAQFEAYCRAVLTTFKAYLAAGAWRTHSYALARAFHNIESAFSDAYKLNDPNTPLYPSDVLGRLSVAVDFVGDAIRELEKIELPPEARRLPNGRRKTEFPDVHDNIAALMFDLILAASRITDDQSRVWSVQHNAVWSHFFEFGTRTAAKRTIQFKLRRLIYDEITDMKFLNYQSSRVLGLALNVLGFKTWAGQDRGERALQKSLLAWVKRNLHQRWEENPDVVESGLPAGISYDPQTRRLAKTYAKGLSREVPTDYFELDQDGGAIEAVAARQPDDH